MPELTRILLVNGHPQANSRHLNHVLLDAYAQGAEKAGYEIRRIDVAALDFPLLRSREEWENGTLPPALEPAQQDIGWAQHLVFFFPLWLGDMPALLKGFLEQVARPGFAFHKDSENPFGQRALGGRSARVVVTMGMPALVYRWYFRSHSVKSMEKNILGFVGISPIRVSLIGLVDNLGEKGVRKWQDRMRKLGKHAK